MREKEKEFTTHMSRTFPPGQALYPQKRTTYTVSPNPLTSVSLEVPLPMPPLVWYTDHPGRGSSFLLPEVEYCDVTFCTDGDDVLGQSHILSVTLYWKAPSAAADQREEPVSSSNAAKSAFLLLVGAILSFLPSPRVVCVWSTFCWKDGGRPMRQLEGEVV